MTHYLIDGTNNNKVVNEFDSIDDANIYLNTKKIWDNWEENYESFEDYMDEFFTISSTEMNDAIRKHGARVLNYWT